MTALRREVFERDNYRCQHILYRESALAGKTFPARCGKRVTWESGHLAHIIPRSRGGPDTAENTCCKCPHCHLVLEHAEGGNGKIVPAKTPVLATPEDGETA